MRYKFKAHEAEADGRTDGYQSLCTIYMRLALKSKPHTQDVKDLDAEIIVLFR